MKIRKIERKASRHKLKVAAYCRVSTAKDRQEDSFETQCSTYARMIQANPLWEFAGIYADEKSGTSANREGFQRMIQDAQHGKIHYILSKSISRFSRNVVDCRFYIELLEHSGVTVYFERENLESTAPGTSMMLSLMAAIAQDESRSNSENHRWATRRRYERGEYHLGNNQVLGYDADASGTPIPNGDAWMIQMTFRLFVAGKSIPQIVRALAEAGGHCLRSEKPLSSAHIRYILRNEIYVGDRLLQKQHPKNYLTKRPDASIPKKSWYLKDEHPPLIDRETWEKAKARIRHQEEAKAKGLQRKRLHSHFLSGLIYCAECGYVFCRKTYQTSGTRTRYKAWICKHRMHAADIPGSLRCNAPIVREQAILDAITEQLHQRPTEATVISHIAKVLIGKEGIRILPLAETPHT